jgi:hypothetical protein
MKAEDKKRGHKNERAVMHETIHCVPYCGDKEQVGGVLTEEALIVAWLNDCMNRFRDCWIYRSVGS